MYTEEDEEEVWLREVQEKMAYNASEKANAEDTPRTHEEAARLHKVVSDSYGCIRFETAKNWKSAKTTVEKVVAQTKNIDAVVKESIHQLYTDHHQKIANKLRQKRTKGKGQKP